MYPPDSGGSSFPLVSQSLVAIEHELNLIQASVIGGRPRAGFGQCAVNSDGLSLR